MREKMSSQEGTRPPESLESKEKKPERNKALETAFDIEKRGKDKQEPFFDEETIKDLALRQIAQILCFGKAHSDYGYGELSDEEKKKNWDANTIYEILQYAPRDPEIVRLRQGMLADFIEFGAGKKKNRIEFLKELRSAGDELRDILCRDLSYDTAEGIEDAIGFNMALLRLYTGERVERHLPIEKQIKSFEDLLVKISGQSKFFRELKESIQVAMANLRDFKRFIQDEQCIAKLKGLQAAIKEDNPSKTVFGREELSYRDFLDAIEKQREEKFGSFQDVLRSLDIFLVLSNCILERGLNKIEITDEKGVLELKGAKSLILMADKGEGNVEPFDIKVTKEAPIVFVTGDNRTGKSKLVDAIAHISNIVQAIGYGPAASGRYSTRSEASLAHTLTVGVHETQYSRGEKEMKALVELVKTKKGGLLIMDEFLTSTDSLGALSTVIAGLEEMAKKGVISFVTMHSRDLEQVCALGLASRAQFIKAKEDKDGKKTYQWEEGVGRANPLPMAEEMGMPANVVQRAKEIQARLEQAAKK